MKIVRTPHKQSGLALMTVLLVFSIVSVLATAMLRTQSTDIQRSANMFALQQARSYALGAEEAVKAGLHLDWKRNKAVDHLEEEWAQERTFPLDPGRISLWLADLQGRFNLNWLSPNAANPQEDQKRFARLLNVLGLDVSLAQAWSKWLDKRSNSDNLYMSKENVSYRPAYGPCLHVSELRLLDGMSRKAFDKLEPYVSCLPSNTPLNINTASAVVVASLAQELTLSDAEQVVNARGKKGFSTIDEFWSLSQISPFTKPVSGDKKPSTKRVPWDKSHFSLYTEYFEMFGRILLAERTATSQAMIYRSHNDGKLITLTRDYSRRDRISEP